MTEISVIVPIYNVEKYLPICVESILDQTYTNFEVILVDDGSPDRCGEMCDAYAQQDSRVRVVHKKNGGLSDARNAGLDVAEGKYVTFIDSDDCVHPQYLEILFALIRQENADISMCYYDFFIEAGQWFSDTLDVKKEQYAILESKKLLNHFAEHCRKVSLVSQCMKLYKREIFDGFRMRVGYVQEDSLALPFVLERAARIVKSDRKLYHWRETPGSISRSTFDKRNFDYIEVSYCWAEFFSERKSSQARFFQRDFLQRTLKYYYRVQDENPGLMKDYRFHMKRYRKLYPRYIWAKGLCAREKLAYTIFLFAPKAARKLYMQVYGDRYREERW